MRFNSAKKKAAASARRRPTGTSHAANYASYYASKRSNIPSPKRAAETRKPSLLDTTSKVKNMLRQSDTTTIGHRIGSILLAIVLVACVVSLLQIDTSPRIVMLNGASTTYTLRSTVDYQRAVTESLRSSLLNSNKITINTHEVVNHLQTKFPEIYDASVVLPLVGHRPTVYIELAQPVLALQTLSATAVLDVNGRALLVSPNTGQQHLPIVIDESNIALKVGDVALPSANVQFVKDIVRQFAAQHLFINKMVLPAGKEELDVYPRGTKYYVRFNLHETTSREQAGTFFALYQQLSRQKRGPAQYVDVRLVGRAYYQ